MNFTQLAKEFLQHCKRRELSSHTLRAYRCDLESFGLFYSPIGNFPQSLSKDIFEQWLDHLQGEKLSPASRKRRLACLKVFCRWLEDKGVVENSPLNGNRLKIKQPKRLPRNIPDHQLVPLFALLTRKGSDIGFRNLVLHVALEFLITTGMRIGELCTLMIADVDVKTGSVRVVGKGARER
ncbi:MAG: site-specific integrase, partial [Alphaproteobacteria bacterium]|nr:site-specific integrase [Alphaproteobacteria bacterium]